MEKIALWWDMDGCPLPSHMDPFVVRRMANSLLENFNIRGSGIGHQFSAYKYPSAKEDDIELGQTMVNSGINLQLVQPALAGNGNEIEKMVMADVLLWAMDTPPPGDIIFIVGNVDFSYVFHKLRERSYNVFLVCASVAQMPHGMLSSANECLGWSTFLKLLEQNEEMLQFPSSVEGCGPENYQAFSNVYPRSPSTVSSKEWEEYQSRSSFGYMPESSSTGQPAFNDGWDRDSSQFSIPPLNDAVAATVQEPQGFGFLGHGSNSTENSSTGQPTFHNGWDWDSSQFCIPPLNDTGAATEHQPRRPGFQGHGNKSTEKPMNYAGNKHRNRKPSIITGPKKKLGSMNEFRAWLRYVVNSKENQNGYNVSPIRMDFEKATGKALDFTFLGFPKMINLLEQCKDIAELKEVKKGCHMAFPVKQNKPNPLKSNKPHPNPKPMKEKPDDSPSGVNPNSYPCRQPDPEKNLKPKPKLEGEAGQKSMPKASAVDFHVFLLDMVNSGEFSQGFLMSKLPQKFESVTGKCLDIQHLGFQKLTNLVEVYSSLVSVDKIGPGPPQLYPSGFVREAIPNSILSRTSESEQKSMPKASVGDFHVFLSDMVSRGEFSQGFMMSQLRQKFESVSGKCLDIQHLGFQKLTNLVEVYSNLVSLDKTRPGPTRLYPAGFVRETIPNSNLSRTRTTSGEISINMVNYIGQQEANVEVDYRSTCGRDQNPENKAWKDDISHEDLSCQSSELAVTENEWPSGGLNSFPSMSFTPTEPKGTKFQEYGNKSDSCSTPQGSQVSEWEGQFSNTVSELSSHADSHQLEGSEYAKQFVSSLQREGNIPIGNSANVKALQNTIKIESVCKEAFTVTETATYQNSSCGILSGRELPDFVSSQLEPPIMDLRVSSNVPVSPLHNLPQETDVCSKSFKDDTSLECKQSEQNAKSAVHEERNVHNVGSPAESIMQVAGRGLKTLCEFTMWKKNQ